MLLEDILTKDYNGFLNFVELEQAEIRGALYLNFDQTI
jgi:hypothetical protein